jgi:hypothetical protein
MRARVGRAHRNRPARSRPRRLIALLIPPVITVITVFTVFIVITFTCLLTPPPRAAASPAPPKSQSDIVWAVPPGTGVGNDQQLEAAAHDVADDPRGEALTAAYKAFGLKSGNVSVEWFDVSWLPDNLGELIWSHLDTAEARNIIHGSYSIKEKIIEYAGNEALFDTIGAAHGSWLIQVSNNNVYHGTHSELIPLKILESIILGVLQKRDPGLPKITADAQANAILARSALELATGNSPCFRTCNNPTKIFGGRYAVSYYGRNTQQHNASTARVNTIMGKAIPLLGKGAAKPAGRDNAEAARQASAVSAAVQKVQADLGLPAGTGAGARPKSTCVPRAAGQPGSGGAPDMTLMAYSAGAPCTDGEGDGEGAPGGLVKALTSGNLGGVDFSTLQLRYMSDDPDSTGLQYSFSGQKGTFATARNVDTALSVLTDNAADLRTWLVLNPDEFWVNLNPAEPDRIIDASLGETNAGRELLDADFQLKRSSATLMNPNTKLGARYWHDLAGATSSVCYGSRMWIVPGQVQVREDGGSLYILKARLAVKAVPEHVADMPASCHYNAQTDARGQRLDDTMIVPLITKMVNTAAEYAPIRRAFMARIVAQWIRGRHAAGQRTSFDGLIGSGNIGPAKLTDGWQPRQVFNAYVKSLRDGEFTYNTTFHQGGNTYIQKITIGGVDFTAMNLTGVSAAQANQDYPRLEQTARSSVGQLTSAGGSFWLGETIAPPSGSTWDKATDPLRSFVNGRTGILALALAGLGVLIFGLRRGSRRGRQAS